MAQCRSSLNLRTITCFLADVIRFASSLLRPRAQLAAENLFLCKQLALYVERQVRPRRADDAIRPALVGLSGLIEWRQLLIVVKPETLIRWHRKGFGLFWRWKSRPPGRPRVPANLQRLIAEMAAANGTWGEERIASELLVKLGIRVSPRTVRRYMRSGSGPKHGSGSQAWRTFVRNHARSVLACDFFVTVTSDSSCSTCSWWWRLVRGGFCSRTSPSIRRRSGPRNSAGWSCRANRHTDLSSTTTTASTPRVSIARWSRWASPLSRRPWGRPKRTRSANA